MFEGCRKPSHAAERKEEQLLSAQHTHGNPVGAHLHADSGEGVTVPCELTDKGSFECKCSSTLYNIFL